MSAPTTDSERPFFGPTNDLIFKLFLERNLDLLSSVLSAVLGEYVVAEAVLNPGLPGDGIADKLMVLDVRARLEDGRRAFVEMQAVATPYSGERFFAYVCREYSSQLGRGQPYSQLTPTIGVVWYGRAPAPEYGFHETFCLRGERTGVRYNSALTLHVLQLGLLPDQAAKCETESQRALRNWGALLAVRSRQELRALVEEEPTMADAASRLMMLSDEPEVARLARARAEAEFFHEMDLRKLRAEGEAEGEARGRAEGEARAKAETVLRQITLKFGAPDEGLVRKVREASSSELDRLAERVLFALSAQDLFDRTNAE